MASTTASTHVMEPTVECKGPLEKERRMSVSTACDDDTASSFSFSTDGEPDISSDSGEVQVVRMPFPSPIEQLLADKAFVEARRPPPRNASTVLLSAAKRAAQNPEQLSSRLGDTRSCVSARIHTRA